jgi:hypothetical protein
MSRLRNVKHRRILSHVAATQPKLKNGVENANGAGLSWSSFVNLHQIHSLEPLIMRQRKSRFSGYLSLATPLFKERLLYVEYALP